MKKNKNIFNRSVFILSNIEINYFNGNIDGKEINLSDLQELRDRIIISTNIYRESKLSEDLKNKYQQYIRLGKLNNSNNNINKNK